LYGRVFRPINRNRSTHLEFNSGAEGLSNIEGIKTSKSDSEIAGQTEGEVKEMHASAAEWNAVISDDKTLGQAKGHETERQGPITKVTLSDNDDPSEEDEGVKRSRRMGKQKQELGTKKDPFTIPIDEEAKQMEGIGTQGDPLTILTDDDDEKEPPKEIPGPDNWEVDLLSAPITGMWKQRHFPDPFYPTTREGSEIASTANKPRWLPVHKGYPHVGDVYFSAMNNTESHGNCYFAASKINILPL
jgi:hypothetical protein